MRKDCRTDRLSSAPIRVIRGYEKKSGQTTNGREGTRIQSTAALLFPHCPRGTLGVYAARLRPGIICGYAAHLRPGIICGYAARLRPGIICDLLRSVAVDL